MEGELRDVDADAARFGSGHLEDIVDELEEVSAGSEDAFEVIAVVILEPGVALKELSEDEDGVHGGADLVRHARQEQALAPVGLIGDVPDTQQRFLRTRASNHAAELGGDSGEEFQGVGLFGTDLGTNTPA